MPHSAPASHRLDESQPVIPWRVALQQSSPLLHRLAPVSSRQPHLYTTSSTDQRLLLPLDLYDFTFFEPARPAGEQCDGTTVDSGTLRTCGAKRSTETGYLDRNRAQRIPSWPGERNSPTKAEYICADQLAYFTFRLQKSGGPYICSGAYILRRLRRRRANSARKLFQSNTAACRAGHPGNSNSPLLLRSSLPRLYPTAAEDSCSKPATFSSWHPLSHELSLPISH